MTRLSKSIFATLGIGALVAGTLVLRSHSSPSPSQPRLTPAQLAEVAPPPPARPESPKVTPPASDPAEIPPPPEEEPEIEDGNGS